MIDDSLVDECLAHARKLFADGEIEPLTSQGADGSFLPAVKLVYLPTGQTLTIDQYSTQRANFLAALIQLRAQIDSGAE